MTTPDRFERQLPERLAELAPARVPDYFDDLLQATARTRQRPAWTSLGRWLPMDLALPSAPGRPRLLPALGALLILGLLAAAALFATAGSRQHRVPAPFGPAANGSLYFTSKTGDVLAMDPTTLAPRTIIAGMTADSALTSPDGTRVLVTHHVPGGTGLLVAAADGSGPIALKGTYLEFSEENWSPSGAEVAIVSRVNGAFALTVVATDGSAARTLALPVDVHNVWYLPDGSFVFTGTDMSVQPNTFGLYAVRADGSGLHSIVAPSAVQGTWLDANPSPDGKTLVFHRWVDAPYVHGRLYTLDIATGNETPLRVDGAAAGDEFEEPFYLPDGKTVLFKWFTVDGNVRLATVPVTGGVPVAMGPAVHFDVSPAAFTAPDGRSVLAYYPSLNQTWMLDTAGNTANDRQLTVSVTDVPTWQRLAP